MSYQVRFGVLYIIHDGPAINLLSESETLPYTRTRPQFTECYSSFIKEWLSQCSVNS